MGKRFKIGTVAGGSFVLVAAVAGLMYNMSGIGHQTVRLHLGFIGSSIYEYHSKTGRWPARLDDLAETSLPRQSPYWRPMLEQGTFVIVWRSDLKPDPKDNAGVVLVYHDEGLLARLGRVWVCWADLRTEYIKAEELQKRLRGAG